MNWKRIAAAAILIALLLGGWRVARTGEGFERRLLRMGGGVVQRAVQKPERTARIFAGVLATVWVGIAIATVREGRRRRSDESTASTLPRPPQSGSENPPAAGN